jgi:FkbH-like protein
VGLQSLETKKVNVMRTVASRLLAPKFVMAQHYSDPSNRVLSLSAQITDALQTAPLAAGSRRITIAGTSSLLPGNPAWRSLQSEYALAFADFNEWGNALFRGESEEREGNAFLLTVFLQDLVPADQIAAWHATGTCDREKVRTQLEPLFMGIDHFLTHYTSTPLLVAWGNVAQEAAIESAQHWSIWEQIERQWESELRERQVRSKSLYALSLNRIFANAGLGQCLDSRNYYGARCRMSQRGLTELTRQAATLLARITNPAKKVLALDCDNTLWGGVIGEDGLAGIQLGQDGLGAAYVDFQRQIRSLSERGILIVLLSKNNQEDVWSVFDQHPAMVLRREDIAAARINWKNKSENLAAIARELSLGADSFVFLDDNALERESIRTQMPDVCVPEIPSEVWQWPSWLESSPLFASFQTTQEDSRRRQLYQARSNFELSSRTATSENEFLKNIGLCASALPVNDATIARAVQLTVKTNQFNLRTMRYDEPTLRQVIERENTTSFVVHLSDKFGDHGNVGLVIARSTNVSHIGYLDTFLLSCRVLSRHLENWMLQECIRRLRAKGVEILLAEFIPTERNQIAANFLPENGFTPATEWGPPLQNVVESIPRNNAGTVFAARTAEISISHLDIFAA